MIPAEKLQKIREAAAKIDADGERQQQIYGDTDNTEDKNAMAYSDICTLLRAPLGKLSTDLDVALVGVPFDLGVTNRPGARFGPQQIRQVSAMAGGPMHHVTSVLPAQLCRYTDLGDVPLDKTYNLDHGIEQIEEFYRQVVDAGVVPISAGGDHSITHPILKAIGEKEPVGLVHIDAHCDTAGPLHGSKFHHGGPFRNAALAGVLDPERTVQIGIRGRSEPYWDFSYDTGMRVIHVEEFYQLGVQGVIDEARKCLTDTGHLSLQARV